MRSRTARGLAANVVTSCNGYGVQAPPHNVQCAPNCVKFATSCRFVTITSHIGLCFLQEAGSEESSTIPNPHSCGPYPEIWLLIFAVNTLHAANAVHSGRELYSISTIISHQRVPKYLTAVLLIRMMTAFLLTLSEMRPPTVLSCFQLPVPNARRSLRIVLRHRSGKPPRPYSPASILAVPSIPATLLYSLPAR